MGKSKLKKRLKHEEPEEAEPASTKVPINNLPEKFLWMHVKSGTKIRNVLNYALEQFPNYNSVVWTGIGQGIAKTISCAELFKRKHEDLHQVTKLRYTKSKKSKENTDEIRRVPEIHILLTKNIKDTTELGYQAPGDCGEFLMQENATKSKVNDTAENANYATCTDVKQLRLKKKQKRQKRSEAESPRRKIKKTSPD